MNKIVRCGLFGLIGVCLGYGINVPIIYHDQHDITKTALKEMQSNYGLRLAEMTARGIINDHNTLLEKIEFYGMDKAAKEFLLQRSWI